MKRDELIGFAKNSEFDVLILGGGISGARIYSELCDRGYKTILLDKGDFACGTSQASGMMVWGGLLYLKSLDFKTVYKLCKARDSMIQALPDCVGSQTFRYMPSQSGGRSRTLVYFALLLYWLIGSRKRQLPRGEANFPERSLLNDHLFRKSLLYEEAFLNFSDCRFVLNWLMAWQSENTVPLNYCSVGDKKFKDNKWHLGVRDKVSNENFEFKAKYIVNATGVWTDKVNADFKIDSDYKHIFSKGVYINLPRPAEHKNSMIFEMGQNGDSQSYVPWGPVSMWGPTETTVKSLEGSFKADKADIDFLLNMANKNLKKDYAVSDVVSVRTGVRPLAVKTGFNKKVYPLNLSRKYLINKFEHKNFLSIYGGKLTSSGLLAEEVSDLLSRFLKKGKNQVVQKSPDDFISFPGIQDSIPSPQWCRDNEACHTLEDYLRRRTNISQWIANEGFGKRFEHGHILKSFHAVFTNDGDCYQKYSNSVKSNNKKMMQECS